jgi:hypothetical protein
VKVSYVARGMIQAEHETFRSLVAVVSCLLEETAIMSRFQYLAHLTEISVEIAQSKKTSADEVFKTLAALPRDKVADAVKRML